MKPNSLKLFLGAVVASAALLPASATTWYWKRVKSVKDLMGSGYGYARNYAGNWKNAETGENGIPANGDFIVSQGYGGFGGDFLQQNIFGGLTLTQSASGEFLSQAQLALQAGGPGLVLEDAVTSVGTANGYLVFTGSGDAIVDIRNPSCRLYIQKSFYGNENITLVKKGPGTLQNSEGYAPLNTAKTAYQDARNNYNNYYQHRKFAWKAVKLQGGTLDMRQYYWVNDCDFQFDGNNVALSVNCFDKNNGVDWGIHSLELSNCRLSETENVTGSSHYVSGQDARCFIHMFGDQMVDQSFSGEFKNYAGLVWDPQTDVEFVFRKTVSSTAGILTVSNGTIRVTEGAGFPNVPTIVVSGANAKFKVDASAQQTYPATTFIIENGGKIVADGCVTVRALTVDGVAVPEGLYTGTTQQLGTLADWVDGAGSVFVGRLVEGGDNAVTWNGTGNATTLANWNGATELPVLTDGSARVTVAGGSSFVADTNVWVKGFTLGGTAFALSAAEGSELWIGSAGITNPNNQALTVGTAAGGAVVAAGEQTWSLGSGLLTVSGPLKSLGAAPLTITHNNKSPTWSNGIAVDADILIYDTSKANKGSTTITVPQNGNLTFNGYLVTTNTGSINITANAGSTVTFNKLMMSRDGGMLKGSGRIVFKGPVHFRDRPSMSETVTVELHSDGNRLNGNMGTFSGGTLKAMAPYVITKANTQRFTKDKVTNNSTDGGQNTMINAKGSFKLDLNGFDQSIDQLAMHADGNSSGGHVTSPTPAKLHLQTANSYWANHNYNYGFGSGYKSLSQADNYGYETADKGYWEGAVTLSYEAAASGMRRTMMRTSSSTGNIEVVSGTLVFARRAKTANETFDLKGGSSNPYWRLANEDGSWPNASAVVVTGGTLVFEHGNVIGRGTDVFLSTTSGTLQLEEGVRQTCRDLYVDGQKQSTGRTYGSLDSNAAVKLSCFAGTGVLYVRGDGQGMMLMVR